MIGSSSITDPQYPRRMAELPRAHPEHRRMRNLVVEAHIPLAARLAERFRDRGEPIEDLVQVASVGLIKAVDSYNVDRGAAFASYAIPTVVGELKRYFRNRTWDVRPPRDLQELSLEIQTVTSPRCTSPGCCADRSPPFTTNWSRTEVRRRPVPRAHSALPECSTTRCLQGGSVTMARAAHAR